MDLLFKDACILLDDEIDFSQYDADNDGDVDLVIAIYAGYSESMSGNSAECIWPKSGTIYVDSLDDKRLSRYAVSAELNGYPGCYPSAPYKRINGIGTMCHEFCHTLGLPDMYPTLTSAKGDNQGMEYWSLMDSGNYLNNGCAPVSLNAWEREAFGWMEIPTLTETTELAMSAIDEGGIAYRIFNDNDSSRNEYFVIENIQNVGHNANQKGHGLLVYHVDYNAIAFSLSSNSVNNLVGHPRMTVVPADGLFFAQYNVGKTVDGVKITNRYFFDELGGDPFPGTSHVTALNDTMGVVNFQVYNGDRLNKAFEGIREDEGIVYLHFIDDFTSWLKDLSSVNTVSMGRRRNDVYRIDGLLVNKEMEKLPKGFYIRNNKKFVVK